MICGILLAAGAGSRMGRPKASLILGGETLLSRGIQLLRDGGCEPVIVVLGADLPDDVAAVVVTNPDWASGMASSLRAGLAAAQGDAAVVALVDQPGITPQAIERLLASHRPGFASSASFEGELRTPVLFDATLWEEVAAAVTGDAGARFWLGRNPDRVIAIACDDVADPSDLDVPDDLTAWGSDGG
jgi:CTP:molybdopterin cytidylyltransferase MocA